MIVSRIFEEDKAISIPNEGVMFTGALGHMQLELANLLLVYVTSIAPEAKEVKALDSEEFFDRFEPILNLMLELQNDEDIMKGISKGSRVSVPIDLKDMIDKMKEGEN